MKFKLKEYYFRIPDKELLGNMVVVSKKAGKKTITMKEYLKHGKYHPRTIQMRFKTWHCAMKLAGLKPCRLPVALDEGLLFENLKQVWLHLGTQPNFKKMKHPLSKYGGTTYVNHFGSWMRALRRFVEYEKLQPVSHRLSRKPVPLLQEGAKVKIKKIINRGARQIPLNLRFSVLLRDGFRCLACGKSPLTEPGTRLHCDHIVPWSKGGKTVMDNLRTLCSDCNIGKGNS